MEHGSWNAIVSACRLLVSFVDKIIVDRSPQQVVFIFLDDMVLKSKTCKLIEDNSW